jgi:predicted XRE-type DNA-binding protein
MEKIEKGSGNVYADLGLPDAEEMFIKATLVAKLAEIIAQRGWTQTEAAKVIGLSQPKLSKVLNGQFRGVSQAKILDCLAKTGRDVHIVVGPESPAHVGSVDVVFA